VIKSHSKPEAEIQRLYSEIASLSCFASRYSGGGATERAQTKFGEMNTKKIHKAVEEYMQASCPD
jgi:hypothetical protein